jgi:hypothetical protein
VLENNINHILKPGLRRFFDKPSKLVLLNPHKFAHGGESKQILRKGKEKYKQTYTQR